HPERGMVLPTDFIPLAAEIGLIIPLGEWILRTACAEAMTWPLPLKVAVNLSPVQFKSRNLVQAVITSLAYSRLPAERLEAEITESVLLEESDANLGTLHQLRALGVHISMDGFGTGYSTLSYLRSFPFDNVQIAWRLSTRLRASERALASRRRRKGWKHRISSTVFAPKVASKCKASCLVRRGRRAKLRCCC